METSICVLSSVPFLQGMDLSGDMGMKADDSICESIDWCEGTACSLSPLDSDCASISSDFSIDDEICMEDYHQSEKRVSQFNQNVAECQPTIQTIIQYGRRPAKNLYNSFISKKTTLLKKKIDFFSLIPDEVLCLVLSNLDVKSLLQARQVSKRFNIHGEQDEAGWVLSCEKLWKDKVHVCFRAMHLKSMRQSMQAYKISLCDGRNRQEITPNELCFDPVSNRGTIWNFRFKESAGAAWTSFDPWHAGLDARRMVFFPDGTVRQLVADGSDGKFRIEQPFYDADNLGDPASRPNAAQIEMKWRFLPDPMDMPNRPRGAYVRIKVGGRDVPTYIVQRSPTGNWGFIMENCWGLFASFPLPKRYEVGDTNPDQRPRRMRLRRTSTGRVRWLDVHGMESDAEEEQMEVDRQAPSRDEQLLNDQALPTTSRRQWREALLYNYGSAVLPEGNAARDEFDRVFHPNRVLQR